VSRFPSQICRWRNKKVSVLYQPKELLNSVICMAVRTENEARIEHKNYENILEKLFVKCPL
jgi:hypothetical protein